VNGKTSLVQVDELSGRSERRELSGSKVWLRADCDFIAERATFHYSTDGRNFTPLGEPFTLVFQLGTFQGIRYALFAYNAMGSTGGTAAFDSFEVIQPEPRGLIRAVPFGKSALFAAAGKDYGLGLQGDALAASSPVPFEVVDMKLGRVALQHQRRYLSIGADGGTQFLKKSPGKLESFQWIEAPNGDLLLMSLATNRFLRIDPVTRRITADSPSPLPDGSDGARFKWSHLQ
jgi:xylan 1,4-beta-xylosidase